MVGEKGPKSSIKIFRHPYLYINFTSRVGARILVSVQFFENIFKKRAAPRTIESRDNLDNEDRAPNTKPIAAQLSEFEQGIQKLSEVQAMVSEARSNR